MSPRTLRHLTLIAFALLFPWHSKACSVLYFVDEESGEIYVANHEDYWHRQKVTIQILPSVKGRFARLWYGWDGFAQGGVNEHGLFFDGAVTPPSSIPEGSGSPKGNLGDRILASCRTVEEALALLEREKVALDNAHMMIGDRTAQAIVVEWTEGERKLIPIEDGTLIMTNFHLSGNESDAAACPRYKSIEQRVQALRDSDESPSFLAVANALAGAAQSPRPAGNGKIGGTLYSTFIDITNGELVFIPKLDNSKARRFHLAEEFSQSKKRTIKIK